MKRSRRVEDLLDLKPVTDEEFEELLDDKPKKNNKGSRKKKKKSKFEEFF
jgi:hypothetical protein